MTDDMLFMPSIQEDETLYSFCATAASVNRRMSSAQVSVSLLGVRDGMLQHEMLGRVEELHRVLGEGAPSAESLFSKHTLLAYYWPFCEASVRARMPRDGPRMAGGILRAVGAMSRTASVSHPLRWCEACAADDRSRVGRSYWHVEHQFPLSWYCCIHEQPFVRLIGRSRLWHLPSSADTRIRGESAGTDKFAETQIALSRVGRAVADLSGIDRSSIRASARDRLRQIGVLHDGPYGHHHRVIDWFAGTAISALLRQAGGPLSSLADGSWIPAQIFRSRRDSAIRWTVLWTAVAAELRLDPVTTMVDACRGARVDHEGQTQLFHDAHLVRRAPAHVWACFAHANSFEEAIKELGCTRHDLGRWLKADPDLSRSWKTRLRDARLVLAKANIEALIASEPDVRSAEVERRLQADVHWLRQHAPATLLKIKHGLVPRGAVQGDLFGN